MPRFPVDTVSIASGYRDPRRNPTHFGVDLAGKDGTLVRAPERMDILFSDVTDDPDRADNTTHPAPFDGYGPGVVVGRGASGRFHLLAHLGRVGVSKGDSVDEGQVVGAMAAHVGASGSHTHWEVRDVAVDDGPATRERHTVDPAVWVRTGGRAEVGQREVPLVAWLLLLYVVSRYA